MSPNGEHPEEYNPQWCKEKHRKIDEEFQTVHQRIDKLDARLWSIIILGVLQLGGIIGILAKAIVG